MSQLSVLFFHGQPTVGAYNYKPYWLYCSLLLRLGELSQENLVSVWRRGLNPGCPMPQALPWKGNAKTRATELRPWAHSLAPPAPWVPSQHGWGAPVLWDKLPPQEEEPQVCRPGHRNAFMLPGFTISHCLSRSKAPLSRDKCQ